MRFAKTENMVPGTNLFWIGYFVMDNMLPRQKNAMVVTLLVSVLGFCFALYELLSPESGTTWTGGAILVTVATALLTMMIALLAFALLRERFFWLLVAFVLVGAAATAAAGYFLMAHFLVTAMIAVIVVLIIAVSGRNRIDEVST